METKTETAAKEKLGLKICLNCDFSVPGFKRKKPVLECSLSGNVVVPDMRWCFYGKRDNR